MEMHVNDQNGQTNTVWMVQYVSAQDVLHKDCSYL